LPTAICILLVFSKIFLNADLLSDILLRALSVVANRQMYDFLFKINICLKCSFVAWYVFSIALTDLRDLKTILLEIRPTVNHFWINVGDNDLSVKVQNVRQLAYNKCLVFKMCSIFVFCNFIFCIPQARFPVKTY